MNQITTYNHNQAMEDEVLFASAMTSREGLEAMAQVMVDPIKNALNYMSIARKFLNVDELPNGILPRYEKDVPGLATVIPKHGAVPQTLIEANEVIVPIFTIASNPRVSMLEVSSRRFFIIDRAQMKAKESIQKQEDIHALAALELSVPSNQIRTVAGGNPFLFADVTAALAYIAQHDLIGARIIMHPNEYYNDLLGWQNTDVFDQATKRDVMMSGLFGHLLTADVHVSQLVPPGSVYVLAAADYVGVMPVRQDISIIPADEPNRLQLGWVVFEMIGMAIMNAFATAKINKTA